MNLNEGEERSMKLRNKIAAITAAAMLAFTGVGFAAWTFNTTAVVEKQGTGYVTSAMDLKGLEVTSPDKLYVVFDQSKPYWSVDTIQNGEKPEEYNGKIALKATLEGKDQLDGAKWNGAFSKCEVDGSAIATYVTVGALTKPDDVEILAADVEKTFEIALPTLTYTTSKPENLEDYNTMLTAVDGKQVKFSLEFTINSIA